MLMKVLDSTEGRCDARGRYVLSCHMNWASIATMTFFLMLLGEMLPLKLNLLRWGAQPVRGSSAAVTRKIITVSDGFYSKVIQLNFH